MAPVEEIAALRIPLARHHLLKVPHHASANGRHDAVACRDGSWSSSRLWIATAMNKRKVPRFEDGEGLAGWLEHEPEVHEGLLDREDVVLIPHLGSATVETRDAMAVLAARNAIAVQRGDVAITPV